MTNSSQEEAKGMEVVGIGRDGLVEGVLEVNLRPEIQYMGHIAYGVVAPVIISFGILTNVLNLMVLTRPSLRGPTFRYLKWLAVANLLVCVVLLPFTLHSHANPVPYAAALYFAHVEVGSFAVRSAVKVASRNGGTFLGYAWQCQGESAGEDRCQGQKGTVMMKVG